MTRPAVPDIFDEVDHRRLSCGIELAVQSMAERPLVAMQIRFLAGYAYEVSDRLGVARVMEEAITKGTARRDGRSLCDAFDEIGASHGSYTGRETIGFYGLCLPEFLSTCIDLHAEYLRTPTFPGEACEVAVDLARQELAALNDDPGELAKKLLHQQAYGEPLGRHPLGTEQTLSSIQREDLLHHYRRFVHAGRMQVAIAGRVDTDSVADQLEKVFEGFGNAGQSEDTTPLPLGFRPGHAHHAKDLAQEQVAICFPGAWAGDDFFPIEKVLIGVLAGGMSGRLFTEIREKQGLVYWVDAGTDHPRQGGMVHLAAACTPQNVQRTYDSMLGELDRIASDLEDDEIERAIVGLVAHTQTRGDVTQARASRLADDLFFYGRAIPLREKLSKITDVRADDIRRYLETHPRDQLSVLTLGPRELGS